MQTDLDIVATEFQGILKKFITENFDPNDEAVVYALGQVLQDFLDEMEIAPEGRGELAADIISGLGEFNKEDLALYQLQKRSMFDIKDSTVH